VSILILFQMKSMKVNGKMKNNMNKEFEHNEELWLIWEKNKNKMQMIRSVSIPNSFQMKLMKLNHNLKNNMNKEFEHNEELWLI
jgi:hypothetical protein